jgi:LuxR family quorum sensing-dependent transcriptional regulator
MDLQAFLELGDLFGRIGIAASTIAICGLIKQYATRFGLTRLSVLSLTNHARGFRDATLCSDAAQIFVDAFDAVGPFSKHPLVVHARAVAEPFAISSVPGGLGIDHSRCRSFGDKVPAHVNGLIVPLYRRDKPLALAAFVGVSPDLSRLAFDTLKIAVQAGWMRSQELSVLDAGRSTDNLLSPREFECLRWVALGKTDDEIGTILAIAPRTVRFHILNTKAKLGVETRVQAIAKFLRARPDISRVKT